MAKETVKPEWLMDDVEELDLTPGDEQLGLVRELAEKQLAAEDKVEDLEVQLSEAKEALRKIQMHELPEAMSDLGIKSFQLKDGSKIEVKDDVSVSLPKEGKDREAVFKWFRKEGHDDIIKNEIKFTFGRGEGTAAKELLEYARSNGLGPDGKASIHAQTLKAWVKERRAAGLPLPDLLKVYDMTKAKIKKPGKKA